MAEIVYILLYMYYIKLLYMHVIIFINTSAAFFLCLGLVDMFFFVFFSHTEKGFTASYYTKFIFDIKKIIP